MADIFVSYSRDDHDQIKVLVGHLTTAGYSVWWDSELLGGTRFSETIEKEVESARIVLVAWSPSSVSSRWVADEADLGLQSGKMVPICLGGVTPPIGFRQIQSIDFSGWRGGVAEEQMAGLLAALKHQASHPVSGEGPGGGDARKDTPEPAPQIKEVPETSIAVLPFVNMSPDPEQEYFADGISEELLNLLAKIKEVTVIARTSSFSFKGSDLPISEIGRQLQVAHILEGSVRKAGNRVRITAQLIETRDSSHLWSETYDRTLDDIFAIQDEISAAIVEELKSHLLADLEVPATKPQENMEAYQDLLLGKQLMMRRTRQDLEAAQAAFERAIAADPIYVEALVALAEVQLLLSDRPGCYGSTPIDEALAMARARLDLAERLVPEWDEAWSIKSLASRLTGQHAVAFSEAEKAVSLNPNNVRAHVNMGVASMFLGDPTLVRLSFTQKALELDPMSLNAISTQTESLTHHGRYSEARELIARARVVGPDTQVALVGESAIDLAMGNYAACLERVHDHADRLGELRSRQQAFWLSSYLGETYDFREYDPVRSFDLMLDCNRLEAAAAYWVKLKDDPSLLDRVYYDGDRMKAIWHARNENWEEAERIFSRLDEHPDKEWTPGYNLHGNCQGAVYLLHARLKLGLEEEAARVRKKLERVIEAQETSDLGSEHQAISYLRAVLATFAGDKELAMDALETHLSGGMGGALSVVHMPAFETLAGEPRFQALLKGAEDHMASEREKAIDNGHLPLRQDVLDLVLAKEEK